MQDVIDWGFSLEIAVIQFLTQKLHIPFYLIKLTAVFLVALWICILLWQFSRHLARKNLFALDLSKYRGKNGSRLHKIGNFALYILKYLILFPIYTLVWGAALVIFLTLLVSESNYANIMFFSAIVIAIIRAIAYFNEPYAQELAKVLPLWLLVTVMLDPTLLTNATFTINIATLHDRTLYMSIGFIIVVEWILRAMNGVRSAYQRRKAGKSGA